MKYALLHADEDGNVFKTIDNIDEFLKAPSEYQVEYFMDEKEFENAPGFQEWSNKGVLIKYEVIKPKEKTVAWKLD